jgi:hypothetical protein
MSQLEDAGTVRMVAEPTRDAIESRPLPLVEEFEIDLEEAGNRAVARHGRDGPIDIAVLDDPLAEQLKQERVPPTPAADLVDVTRRQIGALRLRQMALPNEGLRGFGAERPDVERWKKTVEDG